MTPARLAELRRLCEAATSGPWKANCGTGAASVSSKAAGCAVYINVRTVEIDDTVKRWQADATFIATARTAVVEPLDEVERLNKELNGAKARLYYVDLADESLDHLAKMYQRALEAAEPGPLTDALSDALDDMRQLKAETIESGARADAAEAEVQRLRAALENVFMLSRRMSHGTMSGTEASSHLLRFCKDAGIGPTILRDGAGGGG